MARPKKQVVDYFPHYCDHGKVLFILENHFHNDGYAVFYKLMEVLAKTEGHCYDCSTLENWEYLLSKMGTDEETVINILNKLSSMNVIDQHLWEETKIWMQSFVDSISDVYGRRKVDNPIKPELLHTETPLNGINEDNNPQSKVKESKVKEKKIKHTSVFTPPDFIPPETWNAYLVVRKKKKAADTPYALSLIISSLKKIQETYNHDPVDVLNKSIKSGWVDVYPLKDEGGNNGHGKGITRLPKEYIGEKPPEISEAERAENLRRLRGITASPGAD